MCPVCLAAAAVVVGKVSAGGGVAALLVRKGARITTANAELRLKESSGSAGAGLVAGPSTAHHRDKSVTLRSG